jgi:hypothetical protein
MADLTKIGDPKNGLLNYDIQGIELQYTLYDPNLDIFITNLFLVQRDINGIPTFTIADAIPFNINMYETAKERDLKKIDLVRIIFLFIIISSIVLRIYQKYKNNEKKGCTVISRIIFTVILQMKNVLILFAAGFLIGAYINFSSGLSLDSLAYYKNPYFYDFYQFASNQKEARNLEILSMYLLCLYSLKYLQLIESIQILFIAFKKASFEYFSLLVTIAVLFCGLSILTNFVFGSYIYEYKNFVDSVTMNIKIFIFIENTSVTTLFLNYFRVFSIIVLIIFIFLIRYFLLNLFYPIFIEYYRLEVDKYNLSKIHMKLEGEEADLTFTESILII